MPSDRLLQPLWSYIIRNWGNVISYWLFPAVFAYVVLICTGIYFTAKDIGPWKSVKTRIHKDVWPTKADVLQTSGLQLSIYTLLHLFAWYAYPIHVPIPEEAPTVWELVRDLTISLLIGDFLVYLEHIVHHKIAFLYKHVHYVHHRFKYDLFAWSAGWVHPFEISVFFFCEILYPWILQPVHPLTLWIHLSIFVALLLEEHSGHDVWWSPYHLVPDIFGGAVPHDLHHTKVKTNYGFIFAIWDRIFGTYMDPSQSQD